MKILLGVTALCAITVITLVLLLENETLSSLGSMLAGAGSLLAVLWFSASLRYQSRQLKEQKEQFVAQFEYMKENDRRDALMLSKDILTRAEDNLKNRLDDMDSINDVVGRYMKDMGMLGSIVKSADPHEVYEQGMLWLKTESAVLGFLQGIKTAAEVYFKSVGVKDIDFAKPVEEFVFIYSPWFEEKPFFNLYAGNIKILADMMIKLKPGRDAANIAIMTAIAQTVGHDIVKKEKFEEDVRKHIERGYTLPEIAKTYQRE